MRRLLVLAIAVLLVAASAGAAVAAPVAGSADQWVEEFSVAWVVECEDESFLVAEETGWVKGKWFSEKNKQGMLIIWQSDIVYTNRSGDTWLWRERGPDKLFFDKKSGVAYLTVAGRSILNSIGHLVIKLDTGEVELAAGQQPFDGEQPDLDFIAIDNHACSMLGSG